MTVTVEAIFVVVKFVSVIFVVSSGVVVFDSVVVD